MQRKSITHIKTYSAYRGQPVSTKAKDFKQKTNLILIYFCSDYFWIEQALELLFSVIETTVQLEPGANYPKTQCNYLFIILFIF